MRQRAASRRRRVGMNPLEDLLREEIGDFLLRDAAELRDHAAPTVDVARHGLGVLRRDAGQQRRPAANVGLGIRSQQIGRDAEQRGRVAQAVPEPVVVAQPHDAVRRRTVTERRRLPLHSAGAHVGDGADDLQRHAEFPAGALVRRAQVRGACDCTKRRE